MPHLRIASTVATAVLLLPGLCAAQAGQPAAFNVHATAELPDAPSSLLARGIRDSSSSLPEDAGTTGEQQAAAAPPPAPQVADKHDMTIKAGESAQPLNARDKFAVGLTRQLTLGSFASWNVSAGLSHLNDSRPHYGTDRAGFGERLGADALRSTSQSIFLYGIYSNLFHSDPRYYVLGPQHTFKQRVIYAGTRVFVTRKDDGSSAPNWALFSAIASTNALTNAYYPERDRNVSRTVTGLLASLASRTGSQQLREFRAEIRQRLHLKP